MTEREYRQQLEQQKMQQRKRRKRKKRRRGLLIFLFLTVCASVVAGLFYAPFFNIGQVYCMGNVTLTEQEILTAAAVPMGQNIFRTNVGELKRRVASIPYVEQSNVRRVFPNKIKIWVKECQPAAYIRVGEQFAVINTDGRVLELRQDNGAYALPVLFGTEVAEAVPGTNLKETVGAEKFETTMQVLTDLKNAGMLERVNAVDVSYLKDIKIEYENRVILLMGSYDNFAYRLQMVQKVLTENMSAYEKAIMDYRGENLYVRPRDGETLQDADARETSASAENGAQAASEPDAGTGAEAAADASAQPSETAEPGASPSTSASAAAGDTEITE